MLITQQHPKGGPRLKSYGLYRDESADCLAYKVGYLPDGEPIGIRLGDITHVLDYFGVARKQKLTVRQRLIKLLGGVENLN